MLVSRELYKELAEEMGVALTIPNDDSAIAYWNGYRSGRTVPIEYCDEMIDTFRSNAPTGTLSSYGKAFNAGIEERVCVQRRLRKKIGWFRYYLSQLLPARYLAK